jgi:hypothetical protein
MLKNPIRYVLASLGIALASISAHAGTMTMSSPVAGTTVSSPINVVATANSSYPITGFKIYLDGTSVFSQSVTSVNTNISASTGSHKITTKAWDKSGAVFSSSISVTVGSSTNVPAPTPSPTPIDISIPSTAKAFSQIEQMSGWSSCTKCAGGGANAVYSITQNQSSPSLDGNSTKIVLGGTTPFSHALMWRRMGTSTTATNFVFDMYYQIDYPANSQGLEFAANQDLSSGWYKFSTQCAFSSSQWRVWDSKNKGWVNTGIACTRPPARTWQHVTFEYQRSGGKAVFVAITVNGQKHYVNKSFYPQAKTGDGSVGIHFQVDGNSTQADYTTWIDRLSFYYW